MPKFKIVCVLLAAVLAAAGTVLVIRNLTGEEIPFFEKPTDDPNTYIELTDDVDITNPEVDVREFLFIAHKVLLDSEGFVGVSTGYTMAVGVKQEVLNTRYVIGEFDNKHVLKEMITSGIVKNAYQLYLSNTNYIYRKSSKVSDLNNVTWADTAQPLTEASFYNDFGHRNDKLAGYILNWDTVLRGELTDVQDGLYTFHYVLDNDTATPYMRREMITNGGLSGEPTYTKTEIYVTMDANFNIKSFRTDCNYKVSLMGMNPICSQDITEYFEPYDGELPHTDFYKDYFDQEGGELDKELGALDVLMAMFAPYLDGNDLQVALTANRNGSKLASALLSVSGLDIEDLTKLQVSAQISDVNLAYVHSDGAIYVKYQDFQGSTTVDGLLGLVDTISNLLTGESETSGFDTSFLDDFDVDSLLENLTYTLYDNDTKCVVNLPVSLAGVDVEANLYADVEGETYTFTYATIAVSDVEVRIEPQAWSVLEIDENDYPEILGLADLIAEGKLALTASVDLTIDGTQYAVTADVLVDLATMNLQVSATIDKYGAVRVTLVDGVAYVAVGGLKVKLDTANIDQLVEQIQDLIGGEISVDIPDMDINKLLGSFGGITASKCDDGRTAFELSLGGVEAKLYLANVNGRWQLDTIVVTADGVDATVAPSDSLDDVVVPKDSDYADVNELIDTFADPILSVLNAQGYAISVDGSVTVDGKTYAIDAALTLKGNNVHLVFTLSYNGVKMFDDAELWVVDGRLYLHAGDIKLVVDIGEAKEGDNTDFNIVTLKDTLNSAKGYNKTVDDIVELVLSLLDTQLDALKYDEIVTSTAFANGKLTLGVDGAQFGLSKFTLGLATFTVGEYDVTTGLSLSLANLAYKGITLNINRATVLAYDAEINAPSATEDFTTNLVVDVQEFDPETNASGEHNVIYVNLDLINGVVLARIETTMKGGDKSNLDVKYTIDDKVLKLTNGGGLNVLVNIDNIADIINRINDIVNEFADAGDQELPDLLGDLFGDMGDIDLKEIVKSLSIGTDNGSVLVGLSALGMKATASFKNGLNSVTVPVDLIESNLVVKFGGSKVEYSKFSDDDSDYVSIDQVFDYYYYGADGEESDSNGPIYNLVHTNSWLFTFNKDALISVLNDDGVTSTVYKIVEGSYVSFYYNKTEKDNFKIRANLTVQIGDDDFLYLDVAFIDGRIYATYYSNKRNNDNNELKATVSLDAILETIDLLPALTNFIPQIGTLMDSLTDAMSNMESKLTLGNVSKILHSVSFVDGDDNTKVFTLEINGQAIDANNFGTDPITLKVSDYGTEGLRLDQLSLSYGGVSVNVVDLVVTGSKRDENDEFTYVNEHINSYLTDHGGVDDHMNFDSIRELLTALTLTAGNFDENGGRSFLADGRLTMDLSLSALAGLKLNIDVTMYADIDEEGYSYFAVRLYRIYTKATVFAIPISVYADNGGYSYLTFNSKTGEFNMARNSITKITSMWCTRHNKKVTDKELLTGEFTCRTSTGFLQTCGKDYLEPYEYSIQSEVGEEQWKIEGINSTEFLDNLVTGADGKPGYLFKLLNLSSMVEGIIYEQITAENDSVYGIEDVLKSYAYTFSEANGGQFAVSADLSPISGSLGTLSVTIHHSGNFDNVIYDDEGNLLDNGGVLLDNVSGGLKILGSLIDVSFNLNHTTPDFGIARDYVLSKNFAWLKTIG